MYLRKSRVDAQHQSRPAQLDRAFLGQTCGHHISPNSAPHGRTVNLGRVFPRKCAATVEAAPPCPQWFCPCQAASPSGPPITNFHWVHVPCSAVITSGRVLRVGFDHQTHIIGCHRFIKCCVDKTMDVTPQRRFITCGSWDFASGPSMGSVHPCAPLPNDAGSHANTEWGLSPLRFHCGIALDPLIACAFVFVVCCIHALGNMRRLFVQQVCHLGFVVKFILFISISSMLQPRDLIDAAHVALILFVGQTNFATVTTRFVVANVSPATRASEMPIKRRQNASRMHHKPYRGVPQKQTPT